MPNQWKLRIAQPVTTIPEDLYDLKNALARISDAGYDIDFGLPGISGANDFIHLKHRVTGQELFLSMRQDLPNNGSFVLQESVPPRGASQAPESEATE